MTKKRHKILPNLLKELASEHSDETALICDGETPAFVELEDHSRYLAGRLARHIGKGRALEMIMTGCMMDAEEALSAGLVSKVVPQEDLVDAVEETAEQVLTKGPLAVRLAKLAVQAGYETDQRTGLLIELLAQASLLTSEDTREVASTFLEEREPDFKGR